MIILREKFAEAQKNFVGEGLCVIVKKITLGSHPLYIRQNINKRIKYVVRPPCVAEILGDVHYPRFMIFILRPNILRRALSKCASPSDAFNILTSYPNPFNFPHSRFKSTIFSLTEGAQTFNRGKGGHYEYHDLYTETHYSMGTGPA